MQLLITITVLFEFFVDLIGRRRSNFFAMMINRSGCIVAVVVVFNECKSIS